MTAIIKSETYVPLHSPLYGFVASGAMSTSGPLKYYSAACTWTAPAAGQYVGLSAQFIASSTTGVFTVAPFNITSSLQITSLNITFNITASVQMVGYAFDSSSAPLTFNAGDITQLQSFISGSASGIPAAWLIVRYT